MNIGIGFRAIPGDKEDRVGFAAAAVSVGFELVDNTPGVSNVYSTENKYDPEEQGDIRYYIPLQKGALEVSDIAKIWIEPGDQLKIAEQLPSRITGAKTAQDLAKLCVEFDGIYLGTALAHMRLFSLSRISLAGYEPGREEVKAIDFLDSFSRHLEDCVDPGSRKNASNLLIKHWRPAMMSWLRAYKANYLELSNLWKEVPKSIKISRGNGLPPLVIPQGPKFEQMLKRWT